MPRGTFIQNRSRQPSVGPPTAMSRPPSVGPNAVATPIVAPKSPNARPRSSPWKSCCTRPSTCGICTPAATPCRMRATSRVSMFGASAHNALATVNPLSPMMNITLREYRSPSRPAGTKARPKASA